jgi:C1A family cysteine protease
MKYSKRYISFTILLVLVLLVRFQVLGTDSASIGQFRGGKLAEEVWNPLIADEVNGSLLRVMIDNKEYTNENTPFYMNENRNIMVPVSILRDALNCSAHVYDEAELLVEKHNSSVFFRLDEPYAVSGDELVPIQSAFTKYQDNYYVSLSDLSELLGYSCSFDITSKTLTTADTSESATIIPSRYDLREKGRVSKIRNQGTYGTCWAFAAASALESTLLPEEPVLFAVDHMTLCNSFNVNQYDGGEYTMGMAYLAAWQGPVYEADDPYGDGVSDESLTAVRHVQEMRIIDGKDYEAIKTAVFKYGGVQTSLYSNLKSSQSESEYFNRETNAYCYIGTEKPNHDVVIIGWDDNYSKDNFTVPLEGDGAFICQNSWGENFGEDGVFYVSYYDTNIGTHNVVYTRVEDTDNYDNIYQSDLCGWVGSLGYEKESIYGANVFTAEQAEEIAAAGFYATGSGTQYEVYVVNNFEDADSLANRKKVAEGTLEQAGYYTIDFSSAVSVEKGERFAIVLYLSTPGATHPLAIEYDAGDDSLAAIDLTDGEGYISVNGNKFTDVDTLQECNLCIKAYTNERS